MLATQGGSLVQARSLVQGGLDDAAAPVAGLRIAVLAPCCNEEATIGKVVADFRAAKPDVEIETAQRRRG